MMRMRVTQTTRATKMGTAVVRVLAEMTAVDWRAWEVIAMETPHQVRMAFMVAPRSQAREVPDLARFVGCALFGGKEAGDACEVNTAEGNGGDGCPGDAKELEIAEEVL